MNDPDGGGAGETPSASWGYVAARIASALGLETLRSPTLKTVIERGARYVEVDEKAGQVVFNTRALFIGFVAAGQQDTDSISYGNTASWFVDWLAQQVGDDVLGLPERVPKTQPERLFNAIADGAEIQLSASVSALMPRAAAVAQTTVGRMAYEARHLFGAMILNGVVSDQTLQQLRVDLKPQDLKALKLIFIQRVLTSPEPGETDAAWQKALEVDEPASGSDGVFVPPDGVTSFNNDAVGSLDVLDTQRDAQALARLLCLEGASPLALAIFGGWGAGKSTFMNQLEGEIRKIAPSATGAAPIDSGSGSFVRRVVQIRFNAWQFVDANLWASLAAEFFDQLRAGGFERVNATRYAGLVGRVNGHVHALNEQMVAKREAVLADGKSILEAQRKRDEAAQKIPSAGKQAFGQAAVNLLSGLFQEQKSNLSRLGLAVAGVDVSKSVDTIVSAAKASKGIWGRWTTVWKVLAKSPARLRTTVAATIVIVLTLAWGALNWSAFATLGWQALVAGLGLMGALSAGCAAAMPALKIVGDVARRAAEIAEAVDQADEQALKDLLAAELALKQVTREAEARQQAAKEAEQRLARYVDPDGLGNPPRLLRYVLEDDPDTRALQAEVGLIGRTRRLFQAVDDIVREERSKPPAQRLDGDVPDRIVLYIDDLDRCSEAQVYNALQAIHLLLAFDLFVVVVAVDAEWVETALANALVTRLAEEDRGDPVKRRQNASRYLEKIFQVAFWLDGLKSDAATGGGSYAHYVRSLVSEERQAPPPIAEDLVPEVTTGEAPVEGARVEGNPVEDAPVGGAIMAEAEGATSEKTAAESLPEGEAEKPPALTTIQLDAVEVEFLASPAIAAIAARTPRTVKRLVNVYRLVRTRIEDGGQSVLGRDGRPPIYPLVALLTAIETGQPVRVADAFYNGLSKLAPSEALMQTAILGKANSIAKASEKDGIALAIAECPAIRDALTEVFNLRNGDLLARDVMSVARVARRFSFNRFS